jgi:hypothetical protein
MRKILTCVISFLLIFSLFIVPVSARQVEGGQVGGGPGQENPMPNIDENMSAMDLIGKIIDTICSIGFFIGIVMVAIGIFMLVFAYKDDNTENISRGARMAIIGALLTGLKFLLKATGFIE